MSTLRNAQIGRLLIFASSAALFFAVLASPSSGQAPRAPSLYQRVGGYDFIARFVDTAFPRVGSHPQLRRLFQGHIRSSS